MNRERFFLETEEIITIFRRNATLVLGARAYFSIVILFSPTYPALKLMVNKDIELL